jgi:hypothetical protein
MLASFTAPRSDRLYAMNAALALGDDGRLLAYASGGEVEARALIYDAATGQPLDEWNLPGGFEKVAAVGTDRFLLVREEFEPGRQVLQTVARPLEVGGSAAIQRVVRPSQSSDVHRFFESGLTPDGRWFWWTGPRQPEDKARVEVRQVDTGERVLVRQLRGEPYAYVEPQGRRLWVSAGDGTTCYELPTGRTLGRADQHPESVSSEGRWQAHRGLSPQRYHRLSLWADGADRPWLEFASDDLSPPHPICFSPDGRYLAWGSGSGVVTVVDLPELRSSVTAYEADVRTSR